MPPQAAGPIKVKKRQASTSRSRTPKAQPRASLVPLLPPNVCPSALCPDPPLSHSLSLFESHQIPSPFPPLPILRPPPENAKRQCPRPLLPNGITCFDPLSGVWPDAAILVQPPAKSPRLRLCGSLWLSLCFCRVSHLSPISSSCRSALVNQPPTPILNHLHPQHPPSSSSSLPSSQHRRRLPVSSLITLSATRASSPRAAALAG